MIKALIFDVDGTLAETEDVHLRAFNQAFADFKLGWHWDRALYTELLKVTGGKERIRHFIDRYQPENGEYASALIAQMHRAKTRHYTALIDEGAVELRAGVHMLLRNAAEHGMRLAIATTTSLPNVEALLRATLGTDANKMFDVIAAGDQVPNKKPAPDVYLLALSGLGLKADECLAFEDSENGLRSALAAEIPTVISKSVYTLHHDFEGAELVLPDLSTYWDDHLSQLA